MNRRKFFGWNLPCWGLSLLLAVSFLCAFSFRTRIYADESLSALSDRIFNRELSEMVDEYGRDDITRSAAERNPYIAERLIIKSSDPAIDPEDYGAVDGIRDRRGMVILQFDSVRDTKRAEAMLAKEDSTVYVVPDRYVFLKDTEYTQEGFDSLATGESIRDMMSEGPVSIGADELGAELKNVNGQVRVAVLDTGVSFAAEYLSGRIDQANAYSFIDWCNVDVSKDDPSDCDSSSAGHGTHVSGIIARCTEQVGGRVKILPVRVLDNSGCGTLSTVIKGIEYAANNGAQVINMSLGGDADPRNTAISDAVKYAVGKGVTVVVAAGNENDDTMNHEPSNISECVVVGAVDGNKDRAGFSNYGQTLDVVAPGVSIVSCVYYYKYGRNGLSLVTYARQSGTSMATPHAAGASALIKLKYPGASPQQVEQLLQLSTADLGTQGWDRYYGYGFIDLTLLAGAPYNQVSNTIAYITSKKAGAAVDSKAAEEAARQKAAEEAEKKRQAEEAEKKRQAEEAEKKRQAEEAEKKRQAEEAERQRQAEEEARRKAAGSSGTYPHANAEYVIPLKCGQVTKGLKVIGLSQGDYVTSWSSSNPDAAVVSGHENGTSSVTAKAVGDAVISAKTASGATVSFRVRVQKKKISVRGVKLPDKNITLKVGESMDLQAFPYPVSSDKKLKYSSSKTAVAAVSPNGIVTARKAGRAVITVRCGKKKVKVKVKVVRP